MTEKKMSGMMGENNPPPKDSRAGYMIPVLVGIIGGFFAVFLPLFLNLEIFQQLTFLFENYNFRFQDIAQIQGLLILLIGSIFLGFITICFLGYRIRKITDAIKAGIISGVFTGFVIKAIFVVLTFSSKNPTHYYPSVDILIITLTTVFQIGGALCGYLWYRNQPDFSTPSDPVPWDRTILKPAFVAIILIILVLVIPYAFSHLVKTVDWQECQGFFDTFNVERLNEDTIMITQLTENFPADCLSNKPYVNKIFIDDREVSDQTIIQLQGLQDTIDPPEGLVYANGSNIVLKGPDVSNKTHTPQLRIEKYSRTDDGSLILINNFFRMNT